MLLSAEQLTKSYGDRVLLDGVSFYLERGDKVGIIGVNGAGKSTLLRLLAGAEEPDGGTVRMTPTAPWRSMRPEPSSTVWEYPASSRAWGTSPAGSAAGWPWRRCWPAPATC